MSTVRTAAGLVLGVDGGNSKTELVLGTTAGEVLARVRGAGTRPDVDGVAATVGGLAGLVGAARDAAGIAADEPVDVGAFFLANVDLDAEERAMRDQLERAGVARDVLVRNDSLAVLRAGSPAGWGVALVEGAGVNAVGVSPDGVEERFLALGTLTGDWGGGFSLAAAGLGAAVRAGDGRGPATALRDLLPPALGCRTVEEVALGLSRGTIPAAELHRLPPVVLAAASRGDPVAREIRQRLVDEAAVMVLALLRRLDLLAAEVPVVLGGGVLERGPADLTDDIRDRVVAGAPGAQVALLRRPPVAGAFAEALAAAGAPPEALRRAASGLTAHERLT